MTGGKGQGSLGASSSSNSISSGIKIRAAKASGVGAVSGVICGMCISVGCNVCNSRCHPIHVIWVYY